MRRIDRYWKRCGACLLAAVTLMLGQGTMQSYAMNAQVINSPDRIVVQDENKNTGNQNNTNTQTVTTKAEVAGFGEVSTPVTDSSSYFGKGRLTLLANHDTAAQQLAAIIETDGEIFANAPFTYATIEATFASFSAYQLSSKKE